VAVKEHLEIRNLHIVYEPHWVGMREGAVVWEYFYLGQHEIHALDLPRELYVQISKFVHEVEEAYDLEEICAEG